MTDTTELNDLEGVTQHPGWHRIKSLLAQDWGTAGTKYVAALERVANDTDAAQAAQNMRMVIWVRKEIEAFFAGIESRTKQLHNQSVPVEAPQSRRGML